MHNKPLPMPHILFLTSSHQNYKKPAFYLQNTQLDTPIMCLLSLLALMKIYSREKAPTLSLRTNMQN